MVVVSQSKNPVEAHNTISLSVMVVFEVPLNKVVIKKEWEMENYDSLI